VRSALFHLRSMGWLHMDVKPCNVLWEQATQHAFLIDFGLAERWPLKSTAQPKHFTHFTEPYRSPELIRGSPNRGELLSPAVDAWSLGCTLFEAFGRGRLFSRRAEVERFQDDSLRGVSMPDKSSRSVVGGYVKIAPSARRSLAIPLMPASSDAASFDTPGAVGAATDDRAQVTRFAHAAFVASKDRTRCL